MFRDGCGFEDGLMRNHVNACMTCTSANCRRTVLIANAGCRIVLLLLAASCGTALNAAGWSVGILDPSADQFSSMKFDSYGNAHVSYMQPATNELRYGFWDHILKRWFTTTVDRTGGFTVTLVAGFAPAPADFLSQLRRGTGLRPLGWRILAEAEDSNSITNGRVLYFDRFRSKRLSHYQFLRSR